ncbi:hypothetical protein BKA70DRAFT_669498 [Coprinopsis sp. MPI-PUGE-AT-0042]|nr:hypothetical protein BKA70DRAFT_669498 [Coprinopsis sp. MPI-PUGE-AT-0042]
MVSLVRRRGSTMLASSEPYFASNGQFRRQGLGLAILRILFVTALLSCNLSCARHRVCRSDPLPRYNRRHQHLKIIELLVGVPGSAVGIRSNCHSSTNQCNPFQPHTSSRIWQRELSNWQTGSCVLVGDARAASSRAGEALCPASESRRLLF